MANKINSNDTRLTIYAGDLKEKLAYDAAGDRRFNGLSEYVMHLIKLGLKADAKLQAKSDQS